RTDLARDLREVRPSQCFKVRPEGWACRDDVAVCRWPARYRQRLDFSLGFCAAHDADLMQKALHFANAHQLKLIGCIGLPVYLAVLGTQLGDKSKTQQQMLHIFSKSVADGGVGNTDISLSIGID